MGNENKFRLLYIFECTKICSIGHAMLVRRRSNLIGRELFAHNIAMHILLHEAQRNRHDGVLHLPEHSPRRHHWNVHENDQQKLSMESPETSA